MLNFVDHTADAVVVFVLLSLADAAEAKALNNFAQALWFTDKTAMLSYDNV